MCISPVSSVVDTIILIPFYKNLLLEKASGLALKLWHLVIFTNENSNPFPSPISVSLPPLGSRGIFLEV